MNITGKTKGFLLSDKGGEFPAFLLLFFVVGGFWLSRALNSGYEVEFSIPVRLRGVPNNIMITLESASELRVKVKDKGTVFLNYILGRSFYPISLDFSDYRGAGNHIRMYTSQFEKKVLSQLSVSTRLLSIKLNMLEYIYVTEVSKLIPAKLTGTVSVGHQYYLSDTAFSLDSVLVYVPEGALDTIIAAYTQYAELEGIPDALKQQVSLLTRGGVKFAPTSIETVFPVDIYTKKTMEVPLHGINFPTDKVLRAFSSEVQVTSQAGPSRFRQITADDFHMNVSYEELLWLGSDKHAVKLKSVPDGVNQVRFGPGQVDLFIEQIISHHDH